MSTISKHIIVSFTILAMLTCCYFPCFAQAPVAPNEQPPAFAPIESYETHRIRITNAVDGPIQVSTNEGANWVTVGLVTAPATDSLMGYLASGYSKPSTVCATAVHGLRIRVGDLSSAYPKLINVVPKEFAQTPKLFGGHVSGASGIYTNIPVGTSIFRNLAPHSGDTVMLQSVASGLQPMPMNYRPKEEDVLVIIVKSPVNPLREVTFENVTGGDVVAKYAVGAPRIITHVVKRVTGIGRFDGTSYTGVGALNTNHTGVITVSTAPITKSKQFEGDGQERRGGFQIEPAYHNSQSDEAGAPMILVIGSDKHKHKPELEGTPPLFDGYFDLAWDEANPDHSWRAEVAYGGRPYQWHPMPTLIGNNPTALQNVSAIRLVKLHETDERWIARQVAYSASSYQTDRLKQTLAHRLPVERGRIVLNANISGTASVVSFFVDGELVAITNSAPYTAAYDTSTHPDGECVVEVKSANNSGETVAVNRSKFYIDNKHRVKG